jgi:hypothetical protein
MTDKAHSNKKWSILITTSILFLTLNTFAQSPTPADETTKNKRKLNFEDQNIDGERQGPDGSFIKAAKPKFPCDKYEPGTIEWADCYKKAKSVSCTAFNDNKAELGDKKSGIKATMNRWTTLGKQIFEPANECESYEFIDSNNKKGIRYTCPERALPQNLSIEKPNKIFCFDQGYFRQCIIEIIDPPSYSIAVNEKNNLTTPSYLSNCSTYNVEKNGIKGKGYRCPEHVLPEEVFKAAFIKGDCPTNYPKPGFTCEIEIFEKQKTSQSNSPITIIEKNLGEVFLNDLSIAPRNFDLGFPTSDGSLIKFKNS